MTSPLSVVYPADCAHPADRRRHLAHLREVLRRDHNAMGHLYRSGQISATTWRRFLRDTYRPRREALSMAEGRLQATRRRELMRLANDAPRLDIDLDDAFETREVGR